MNIAIVIPAFDRVLSLKRLLKSLESANYNNENVDLIISLDFSGAIDILDVAHNYFWPWGEKHIHEHEIRLGLRDHILYCGDIVNSYDAIILLEDDLFVAPDFYTYAKGACLFYYEVNDISGIALYAYTSNELSNAQPFIPLYDGFDTYFSQVPSSWGQCWTRNQWQSFRQWYLKIDHNNVNFKTIPHTVAAWPRSSWKKYYFLYNSECCKYFVYPYYSRSTNMGEMGTHNTVSSNTYQVPLLLGAPLDYRFIEYDPSNCVAYDTFFESIFLQRYLFHKHGFVLIDYYGLRDLSNIKGMLLTTRRIGYYTVRSWGLRLKPYELNVINDIPGDDLFLYDLSQPINILPCADIITGGRLQYLYPGVGKKHCIGFLLFSLAQQLTYFKLKLIRLIKIILRKQQ